MIGGNQKLVKALNIKSRLTSLYHHHIITYLPLKDNIQYHNLKARGIEINQLVNQSSAGNSIQVSIIIPSYLTVQLGLPFSIHIIQFSQKTIHSFTFILIRCRYLDCFEIGCERGQKFLSITIQSSSEKDLESQVFIAFSKIKVIT